MSKYKNILSQFLKSAEDVVIPSSSGVVLNDSRPNVAPGELTADNLIPRTPDAEDLLGSGWQQRPPPRDPVILQALAQLSEPDEDLAEKPVIAGAHADIQRYDSKGSPEPKTYTTRTKSLAPGAAIGATAGTGISLLVDAASKKGLHVKRALLAALIGAPTGALLQLAYQGATKDREGNISASNLPPAVRGYIDFGGMS